MTGLRLEHVTVRLGPAPLVSLDAQVPPGAVLTVMGPSGSGKSALLAFLGGFLPPAFSASGRVLLDGEDVTQEPPERRRAGLLFQDPLLFPHMTVGGNLLFALPPDVSGRAARRALAEEALASVGLAGFFARDPHTLSGGQRARVSLLRTLLARPRMLLLDEPFSKLDAPLRAQARALVFGEARARGLPVVLVSHDEADAEAAGGSVHRVGA